jgi:pyruvate kinase
MRDRWAKRLDMLHEALLALRTSIEDEEARQRRRIDTALPKHRLSAVNLAHYLGLRKEDLRPLQFELAGLGLSSLGRCEGHVRDTLLRLCGWLARQPGDPTVGADPLDWTQADALLHQNTQTLFGPRPAGRHVYIMVTAPDAADATSGWAEEVVTAGTDLLRINGAHETPREWEAIVSTFKARAAAHGKTGRVFVDLPGPKLRTEIRQLEEGVLHLPRHKDRCGKTLAPTRVLLVAVHAGEAQIPVPADWLPGLQDGDELRLTDAGERERVLVVRGPEDGGIVAECLGSLYVTSGLPLVWHRSDAVLGEGHVGAFPMQPRVLTFSVGDRVLLNESGESGEPDLRALAFSEPGLLGHVRAGERVILDDGRLVAVVETARPDGLMCRVTQAIKSPTRLRSGKGIAFPDSQLSLQELGPQDETALRFALRRGGVLCQRAPGRGAHRRALAQGGAARLRDDPEARDARRHSQPGRHPLRSAPI